MTSFSLAYEVSDIIIISKSQDTSFRNMVNISSLFLADCIIKWIIFNIRYLIEFTLQDK